MRRFNQKVEWHGKVYSLSDKNGNVFYIGCTIGTMKLRLSDHINGAKRNFNPERNPKSQHIKFLNYEIFATILETKTITTESSYSAHREMLKIEREWIKKYIGLGYDLKNREVTRKKRIEPRESVGDTFFADGNLIIKKENAIA